MFIFFFLLLCIYSWHLMNETDDFVFDPIFPNNFHYVLYLLVGSILHHHIKICLKALYILFYYNIPIFISKLRKTWPRFWQNVAKWTQWIIKIDTALIYLACFVKFSQFYTRWGPLLIYDSYGLNIFFETIIIPKKVHFRHLMPQV